MRLSRRDAGIEHGRWIPWVSLALACGVAVLIALVASDPANPSVVGGIDRAWRDLALDAPTWAERASRALATLGSGVVMVPVRILVGLVLLWRRRYRALGAWLLAWVVADAVTWVLKPAVGRVPPDGVGATSFPSAHAKTAAQVALGLALLAPARLGRGARTVAWVAALVWIVAMAVSRTVLDEHWLSDVVTGAMLGAACALGGPWVLASAGPLSRRAGERPRGTRRQARPR